MLWLERIKKVLAIEPEGWLAYIYGQQFENLKHLQKAKPKYQGWHFRFLVWVYLVLRNTKLRPNSRLGTCEYLVYAGTENQKRALDETVCSLINEGCKLRAVAPKMILTKKDDIYSVISYGPLDIFKIALIATLRIGALTKQLKNSNETLMSTRLDSFLIAYNSLVYFDKLLTITQPRFVLVSNDHNVPNRAILALARLRGVKTVYMQHASVSNLFPALNIDYIFLDGLSALESYRKCESNHPPGMLPTSERKIFLSGQKKSLKSKSLKNTKKVGVALNALDSINDVKRLLQFFSQNNVNIKLRWHPSLPPKYVEEIKSSLDDYYLEYSNPRKESLSDFFSDLTCLVAGNSSIHLEAALCHVVPIYYEISEADISDYYGYVKNNLAKSARDLSELLSVIQKVGAEDTGIDTESVKFYSATYGTEWEGAEGRLVAKTLLALESNEDLPLPPVRL